MTSQIATFTTSANATVKVGATAQVSGTTANNYTSPVSYVVTAQDGTTTKTYTVTVTVTPAPITSCQELNNWKLGSDTIPALYPVGSTGYADSGYFTGTGIYYFQGIYEKFESLKDSKNHKLSSVRYSFGKVVAGNDTNTMVFIGYKPDATTQLPGTNILFFKRVLVKTVASNLTSNGDYILDLSSDNIVVNGSFYSGIQMKYRAAWKTVGAPQDTIALLSNTMGSSTINSAYCSYKTSATTTVYDTIFHVADNIKFSLGVFATVCDLSSANNLLTFNIATPQGVVTTNGTNISVALPSGTNTSVLSSLIATFTSSPKSTVTVGSTAQVSGTTANNFTSPVTYTVTAEDGTTQTYTVTVTITPAKSSAKDITAYSFTSPAVIGSISGTNIALTVPSGTNVTALVATFTSSPKSTVTVGSTAQVSGTTANNFTSPVTYTVTAEDGTTKTYTVTVTVSTSSLNTGADLISFGITNPSVVGVITGTNVSVTVPYGTNVTSLVANFTVSTGATVSVSNVTETSNGSVVDYTAPVTFTVTSQDGKTIKQYVVTVTVSPQYSSAKDITLFNLSSPFEVGVISGNTIGLTVPYGTNLTALVPTFQSSPNSTVRVVNTIQVSGVTANNFTSTVIYTVVAQDGTTKDYSVVVTVSPQAGGSGSSAKNILTFGLLSPTIPGTITGTTITINGQAGSDITKQIINFTVSPGATLTLNGTVLTSNVSVVNFSNPVTLTVTAQDGTTQTYVVTVIIPKKNDKMITFFKFLEVPSASGVIDTLNKVVTVHVPYGTDVNNLTSVFGLSSGATASIGGIVQVSGATTWSYATNVYFVVTAENGTTVTYTIKVIIDPKPTAGIENVNEIEVSIYPNPSNGEFVCQTTGGSYKLEVMDMVGNVVYATEVEDFGVSQHAFSISKLGAGAYFATIQMHGTSKMIKLEVVK